MNEALWKEIRRHTKKCVYKNVIMLVNDMTPLMLNTELGMAQTATDCTCVKMCLL